MQSAPKPCISWCLLGTPQALVRGGSAQQCHPFLGAPQPHGLLLSKGLQAAEKQVGVQKCWLPTPPVGPQGKLGTSGNVAVWLNLKSSIRYPTFSLLFWKVVLVRAVFSAEEHLHLSYLNVTFSYLAVRCGKSLALCF